MESERPLGVSTIAVVHVLMGVGLVFGGLLLLAVQADISRLLSYFGISVQWASVTAIGLITMTVGVAYIAIGIGLWRLREWARMVALVLAALGLLGTVVLITVALDAGSSTMAVLELVPAIINGLIVWYLLQPHVASAFRWSSSEGAGYHQQDVGTLPVSEPPPFPVPKPTKPVQQPSASVAWLVVRGGAQGKQFNLSTGVTLLGRDASKCSILIDDDAVSREHAKIRFENGRFWIYDLGSRNGTFVNRTRVQRQMLMDGDEVQVGDTVLVFKETR